MVIPWNKKIGKVIETAAAMESGGDSDEDRGNITLGKDGWTGGLV